MGLTPAQIEVVAGQRCAGCQVRRGQALIIEKGSQGQVFYMIQEGKVRCTDIGMGLGDVDLSEETGGEKALMTNDVRAANVTASESVTLLALDRTNFEGVLGPLKILLDENLNLRVLQGVSI